ncbi:hypothetical protein GCM10027048_28270 [Hymenobacter coalescens]
MLVVVLAAFLVAAAAYLGALAQQVLGVLGTAGDEAGRQGAYIGTVAAAADAGSHHLHVVFLQAGSDAVLTGGHAGVERREQELVLLVHGRGGWVTKKQYRFANIPPLSPPGWLSHFSR